jgi:hypothetical protein
MRTDKNKILLRPAADNVIVQLPLQVESRNNVIDAAWIERRN